MNQEQAKAWLPLIQAVAEGKTIEVKSHSSDSQGWTDCTRYLLAVIESGVSVNDVRIKPEPKKQSYRVALIKNMTGHFVPCAVHDKAAEGSFERSSGFVRWLTDRIEYELPEGEA